MATNKGQDTVTKIIAEKIIEQLEAGVIPWRKPWIGTGAAWSRSNGKGYSIINQLLLPGGGEYATFNQIKKEGGKVNKGAKSSIVLQFFCIEKERKDNDGSTLTDADGNPIIGKIWRKRYERVFNIEKDTNLEVKHEHDRPGMYNTEPIELAEKCFTEYIARHNIELTHHNTNRAFYSPSEDLINLPGIEQFEAVSEYYSTAFHEAAHSTGHVSRLARINKPAAKGSADYGKEELVAELAAAAVVNSLGLETAESFENSAAYMENWKQAIKEDNGIIISASTDADKAYNLIMEGFDPSPEKPEEPEVPEEPEEPEELEKPEKPIKLKKASYYITVSGRNKEIHVKRINGYSLTHKGLKLGIDKRYPKWWFVTELSSGMRIGGGFETRKAAVDWIATAEEIDGAKELLKEANKNRPGKCIERIEKAYEEGE